MQCCTCIPPLSLLPSLPSFSLYVCVCAPSRHGAHILTSGIPHIARRHKSSLVGGILWNCQSKVTCTIKDRAKPQDDMGQPPMCAWYQDGCRHPNCTWCLSQVYSWRWHIQDFVPDEGMSGHLLPVVTLGDAGPKKPSIQGIPWIQGVTGTRSMTCLFVVLQMSCRALHTRAEVCCAGVGGGLGHCWPSLTWH